MQGAVAGGIRQRWDMWTRNLGVMDWIGIALSILALILVIGFIFVPAVRGITVTLGLPVMNDGEVRAFGAGFFFAIGLLIIVHDRVSIPIVRQRNVGWAFIAVGAYLLLVESVGPILVKFWNSLAPSNITFLVIGAVLLVGGYLIISRRNP